MVRKSKHEETRLLILDILDECKSKNMTFHEAKSRLLKLGYTDGQITYAAYNYNYANNKQPDDVYEATRNYFHNNPDAAAEHGQTLLKDLPGHQAGKTIDEHSASVHSHMTGFTRRISGFGVHQTGVRWGSLSALLVNVEIGLIIVHFIITPPAIWKDWPWFAYYVDNIVIWLLLGLMLANFITFILDHRH